ncbi:MAG TPA: tetratricopeptide repeat protein [Thermoanaerobaculia bacterium]|jgi:tetratricopeptide (TPR) repeat protein
MSERDTDDPETKYGPALQAALDGAGDRIEAIHGEIEAAAGLLAELTAAPGAERSERIRTEVRFHALKLCDLLLRRSREAWFRDPARGVELARLAVEIADWLDVGYYGEALVEEERALAWAYLGNALRISSDLRSAEEALLLAEEHYKRGGEDALTGAQILSFLASLRTSQARFEEAAELLDQAIVVYRHARDRHLEGKALIKKGIAFGLSGRPGKAIQLIHKGLAKVDTLEEPRLLVSAHHNLIGFLNESGRSEEALSVLEQTKDLYATLGEPTHLIRLRWLEGRICRDLGRLDLAQAALREARDGFVERGIGFDAARVSLDLATVYLQQGKTGELKRLAAEMVPVFESRDVHQEALAALLLFRQAAEAEEVTLGLLEKIAGYLQRARQNPELRFGEG